MTLLALLILPRAISLRLLAESMSDSAMMHTLNSLKFSNFRIADKPNITHI